MNASQRYQVMPPLSPEEYAALKANIIRQGAQIAVAYDEEGNILHGFRRVQTGQELGLEWPKMVRAGALRRGETDPCPDAQLDACWRSVVALPCDLAQQMKTAGLCVWQRGSSQVGHVEDGARSCDLRALR
jgi:hypothetical protein